MKKNIYWLFLDNFNVEGRNEPPNTKANFKLKYKYEKIINGIKCMAMTEGSYWGVVNFEDCPSWALNKVEKNSYFQQSPIWDN